MRLHAFVRSLPPPLSAAALGARKMSTIAYSDSLVQIDDRHIVVKRYYPNGKDKRVSLDDIETITAKRPSLWTGKWRLSGTGDFRTWFATDLMRFKRDKIFIVKMKNRWWRIGFTAEDAGRVEQIFREKQLLSPAGAPKQAL